MHALRRSRQRCKAAICYVQLGDMFERDKHPL